VSEILLACHYGDWRNEKLKRKYEIPLGTKVEIISEGNTHNGRIGILGAKDPDGLPAYNVWFNDDEFDCFMDDEFIPVQNIITIDNLEYETLCKVFDHNYIYETDRIIVKQKKFTEECIQEALLRIMKMLSGEFAEGKYKDKCGKVIELLVYMLSCDEDDPISIQETLLFEQWWVKGLRDDCKSSKGRKPRYFNPEAKIETIFI